MSLNCPKGDEPCIRGCKGWECRDGWPDDQTMQPELALFFRDLRNHLLHVIDMSKGEHYLDVVRLNAQALIRRIELLSAAPATVAMDAQAGVEDLRREVARLKVENARLAEETMRLQGLLTAAHQIVGELARPSGI